MNRATKFALSLAIAEALSGCQPQVSGSYVGLNDRSATLLQLTETPDQHLTGTLHSAALRDDGSLDKQSENVSGVVDGDNVTIIVKAGPLRIGRNLSGKLRGTGLDLILPAEGDGLPTHLKLSKDDVSEFEHAANDLAIKGNAVIFSRRHEEQKKTAALLNQRKITQMDNELTHLTRDLNQFSTTAKTNVVDRAGQVQQAYAGAVARANGLLEKERAFLAVGSIGARSQAIAAHGYLLGLVGSAGAQGWRVDDTANRVRTAVAALDGRLPAAQTLCDGSKAGNSSSLPAPDNAKCREFSIAASTYHAFAPKVLAATASASAAKVQGEAALQGIMRESDSLLN